MKKINVEQFLYATWNYSREDIEAGLRANDDLYDHFNDKLKTQQSRHGGSYGLLNFLFELGSDRKNKFINAFTWSFILNNAVNQITTEKVKALDYGDEINLAYGFKLYHYTEDDIVVVGYEQDDEYDEILQVMIDGEGLLFKTMIKDSINHNNGNMPLCAVRPDLVNEGLSVPVGDTYVEYGTYQYRWMDDNRFQILLNGQWLYACSADFVFV